MRRAGERCFYGVCGLSRVWCLFRLRLDGGARIGVRLCSCGVGVLWWVYSVAAPSCRAILRAVSAAAGVTIVGCRVGRLGGYWLFVPFFK